MADKNQQVYPLAPAAGQPKSAEESGTSVSKEAQRKKRIKYCAYIVAFAVFQTMIILVFSLTVMRVRTPKVRLGAVTITNLTTGSQTSPSFSMSFIAQITVKNTNFGPYKFDYSTAIFTYGGMTVGEALIPKGKARFRSTKKIDVTVLNLNSNGLTGTANLGSDIDSGFLRLSIQAELRGKVELMMLIKKKKSAKMNCNMTINLSTKEAGTVECE